MNRFSLLLLSVVLCSTAYAQPDPNAFGMGANPPEALPTFKADTPENAVRKFVADFNGNMEVSFAADVVGARVGFYGSDDWEWAFNNLFELRGTKNLKVDDVEVEEQSENEAVVALTVHQERRQGGELKRTEPETTRLRLQRDTNVAAPTFGFLLNAWRVVPPRVEDVLAKPLGETPPFELAAVLTLREPRLLPLIQQQRGLSQLSQLALGALQFVQDYSEFYAFDDAAHERALRPYLKTDSLYIITGTKDERWHFNDNLSAQPLAALSEPVRTVLFYDGTSPDSEHVNFRFGGKTLIGFADGHREALSKDELKNLIWKP